MTRASDTKSVAVKSEEDVSSTLASSSSGTHSKRQIDWDHASAPSKKRILEEETPRSIWAASEPIIDSVAEHKTVSAFRNRLAKIIAEAYISKDTSRVERLLTAVSDCVQADVVEQQLISKEMHKAEQNVQAQELRSEAARQALEEKRNALLREEQFEECLQRRLDCKRRELKDQETYTQSKMEELLAPFE